ncbi:MAG: hypothetical protein KDJ45_11680 [Hyphomicrobiaceae bacterium]|nr:hypothetical protein [Hyphomicrobiaceae bacterium]MCC0011117.1 hypothetical protein [Hyphomicrobiaceae bacterium]
MFEPFSVGGVRSTIGHEGIAATGAAIRAGGERAYYDSLFDRIQMPDEQLFRATCSRSLSSSRSNHRRYASASNSFTK